MEICDNFETSRLQMMHYTDSDFLEDIYVRIIV